MLHRIWAISRHTWSELRHKKAFLLLGGTVIACMLLPTLVTLQWTGSAHLDGLLGMLSNLALFVAYIGGISFGASVLEAEVSKRTLLAVLIRPIGRQEYLAGRAAGMVGFFLLFLASIVLFVCGASLFANVSLPAGYGLKMLEEASQGTLWVLVAVGLGTVMSQGLVFILIIAMIILGILTPYFPAEAHWSAALLQKILHYLLPMNPPADAASGLRLAIDAENVMYGAAVLLAFAWRFARRDLALRDQ